MAAFWTKWGVDRRFVATCGRLEFSRLKPAHIPGANEGAELSRVAFSTGLQPVRFAGVRVPGAAPQARVARAFSAELVVSLNGLGDAGFVEACAWGGKTRIDCAPVMPGPKREKSELAREHSLGG